MRGAYSEPALFVSCGHWVIMGIRVEARVPISMFHEVPNGACIKVEAYCEVVLVFKIQPAGVDQERGLCAGLQGPMKEYDFELVSCEWI